MGWTNFHTHCNLCDGEGELEEYVVEAIIQGVEVLGFSSHIPTPSVCWAMHEEKYPEYCTTVSRLKEKYKDKIQIYLGLELEYGFGMAKDIKFERMELDYTIGSVHFFGRSESGENLPVDDGEEDFIRSIQLGFNGNIKNGVEYYYYLVQKMIEQGDFDIIGHLDLVKKNNKGDKFFCEQDLWYRNIVVDTLNKISKSGKILEVNNGGITRRKIDALYPSNWILEKCRALNIPITINSDAHSPEHIAEGFHDTAKTLIDIGYNEIFVLENGKWRPRKLTALGIK